MEEIIMGRKHVLTCAEKLAGGVDALASLKLQAIKLRSSAMTTYTNQLYELVKNILPNGNSSQWAILVNTIR
jgi:hypothetical protein